MRYSTHAFLLSFSLACTGGGGSSGFSPRTNPASQGYEGEESSAATAETTTDDTGPTAGDSAPAAEAGPNGGIDGWCSRSLLAELGAEAAGQRPEGEPCALLGASGRSETAYWTHLYAYDDEGRLAATWACHRNEGCSLTKRAHDDAGRVIEKRHCSPTRASYERFEHPEDGRRVTLAAESADDADPTPRMRTQLDEGGRPLLVEQYREGEWETVQEFDAAYEEGRLMRRSKLFTSGNAEVIAYEYDDEGRIVSARYWSFRSGVTREDADAIPELDPTSSLQFTYDDEGRLTSVWTGGPSGANFSDLGLIDVFNRYIYDADTCAELREQVRERERARD